MDKYKIQQAIIDMCNKDIIKNVELYPALEKVVETPLEYLTKHDFTNALRILDELELLHVYKTLKEGEDTMRTIDILNQRQEMLEKVKEIGKREEYIAAGLTISIREGKDGKVVRNIPICNIKNMEGILNNIIEGLEDNIKFNTRLLIEEYKEIETYLKDMGI